MIIRDLDHLESMMNKNSINPSSIVGGEFILYSPIISLLGKVTASSNPSTLNIEFTGEVVAGTFAYLRVNQQGRVKATFGR